MNNFRFDKQYLFVTGVIRSYENHFLTADLINKLIISESIDTAITILDGTIYRDFMNQENRIDFGKTIENRKKWLFSFVEKYSYFEETVILLKLEYDYHNIKTLLKEKIFNLPDIDAVVDLGTIEKQTIRKTVMDEKYSNLPELMQETIKQTIEKYYEEKKPLLIDLIADCGLFNHLLFTSLKISSPFIHEYYKLKIDITNIMIFFRTIGQNISSSVKEFIFIDGGNIEISILHNLQTEPVESIMEYLENEKLTEISRVISDYKDDPLAIEKIGDGVLYNYLKTSHYLICGVEPLFAFSQILLIEFKIIGMVLNAKKTGFSPEWIKKKTANLYLYK